MSTTTTKAQEGDETVKLPYEELKKIVNQLQQQLERSAMEKRQILQEYTQAMELAMGKRMESLFQVLKYKDLFNSEFITKTVSDIEIMLTPPETPPEVPTITPNIGE